MKRRANFSTTREKGTIVSDIEKGRKKRRRRGKVLRGVLREGFKEGIGPRDRYNPNSCQLLNCYIYLQPIYQPYR